MDPNFGLTPFLGGDWAFLVLISDGISAILSDDEIVDLVRGANDPKTAAEKILAFSEELGGNDNATAIVIPLAGWNKIDGPDKTRELRDYRRLQAGVIFRFMLTFLILMDGIQWVASDNTECDYALRRSRMGPFVISVQRRGHQLEGPILLPRQNVRMRLGASE